MDDANHFIEVEVAYALPTEQIIIKVDVPEGATIEEAIEASGIIERFSDIDLAQNKVGNLGDSRSVDAQPIFR